MGSWTHIIHSLYSNLIISIIHKEIFEQIFIINYSHMNNTHIFGNHNHILIKTFKMIILEFYIWMIIHHNIYISYYIYSFLQQYSLFFFFFFVAILLSFSLQL